MQVRSLNDIMKPLSPATLEEWEQEKEKIKDNLRFASSVDLLKCDCPLNPQIFGAVEYDGFVVEKVIIQTLPGFYLTGNLYRPRDTSKKYPAVLNPHGHWSEGRIDMSELGMLPVRCANQAMRGMVAFIYDMIGYVDSSQVEHRRFSHEEEKWNYGRFVLQVNNSIKAVDFVASLPYVDTERIGCTGCSGGGTQTYFLTVLDERIKCSAPINMASTRMQGGCVCENTAYLRTDYNNIDYTMAIAPRPLFMSGSDGDWTVTSPTVEFPAVEHVYSLYGASDKYEHFYQHAPHCYNQPTRERVYDFLCRNFGIENPSLSEYPFEPDIEKLRIGDIRPYVPSEGFIENDEQLFALVKKIMTRNLSAMTDEQRDEIDRRVFLIGEGYDCDIPYMICGDSGSETIVFGNCPEKSDTMGAEFEFCYNYSEDAKRVSSIVDMMNVYPNALFKADGKSAALCYLASEFVKGVKLELKSADYSGIDIPGWAITSI